MDSLPVTIGVLKEIASGERRVALVPADMKRLSTRARFYLQAGAGAPAGIPDREYVAAGARVSTAQNVVAAADVLVKIRPPEATETLREKTVLICLGGRDPRVIAGLGIRTVATFGRLDVLVNNAGTAFPKTFEQTTLEEMDRVIDINVRGAMIATQAALRHMKSGGRIIMVGSAVGERVLTPGLVAYSGTKGAVKMFAQALSREVGSRGITVNNVQPGPIDTDLNPASGEWVVPQKAATALERYGHVDEVAALVAFVAGRESSYITGANLTVDGGMNA